jgi:DNA polymerase III delta prime subunit
MKRTKLYDFAVYGVFIGFVLYYYASLAFYQPQDPAFNSISNPPFPLTNPMGVVGANLSAFVLYYVGGGAFLLPFFFYSFFSFLFFRRFLHLYRGFLILVFISTCCFIAERTLVEVFINQYPIRTGGLYGYAGVQLMRSNLSPVGFWCSLLGGGIGSLLLYTSQMDRYFFYISSKWIRFLRYFQHTPPIEPSIDSLTAYSEKMIPLLRKGKKVDLKEQDRFCIQIKDTLLKTLQDFHITGSIAEYVIGPVVTVFEFRPTDGTKQAKILSISDELALALKADAVLISPISAKQALGIQVPNRLRENVLLGDIIQQETEARLPFFLGKSVSGEILVEDLTQMPHLLIAGSTGSGKSIAINSLICSVLLRCPPTQVRLLLIDPKILELSLYEGIPHLLSPVISDPEESVAALSNMVEEMERRYTLMKKLQVRNIESFNQKVVELSEKNQDSLDRKLGGKENRPLPYLLVVIDELADLMLSTSRQIEVQIQRLAQKARASGIHIVVATQRPSVDVITGVIKANFPSRVSFRVASRHDSRTILDAQGAEKLLGKGDLLLQKPGQLRSIRAQGAYVSEEEVLAIATHLKRTHATWKTQREEMPHTLRPGHDERGGDAPHPSAWA